MREGAWHTSTDADLVLAATLGELTAFDELVRRYRPAVQGVARRIVGSEGAEDVAQDAFLLAFKALPQLDEPERFGPWLYAITRHRALRCRSGAASREETGHSELDLLLLHHSAELSQHPAGAVEREERLQEIRGAVERLPEEFQIVLQLRYFESVPVARIAAFLGLPETTVKWRLHRGRKLMRELLEDPASEGPQGRRKARHERAEGPDRGNPPSRADASGNRADGPGREPDRAPGGGQSHSRPAIQHHPGELARAWPLAARPLRAALGGSDL